MKFCRAGVAICAIISLGVFSAKAQDIVVTDSCRVIITDGSTELSYLPQTRFPVVMIGTSVNKTYTVLNDSTTTTLTVSTVTITGPNAADFGVLSAFILPIGTAPTDSGSFTILFAPTTTGERHAQVNVFNNTPGSKSVYSYAIMGNGSATPVPPSCDLGITMLPLTTKVGNKSTIISGKMEIRNNAQVAAGGGVVEVVISNKRYWDINSSFISYKPFKTFKAYDPAKKQKVLKSSFKYTRNLASGTLFGRVLSQSADQNWGDNVAHLPLP